MKEEKLGVFKKRKCQFHCLQQPEAVWKRRKQRNEGHPKRLGSVSPITSFPVLTGSQDQPHLAEDSPGRFTRGNIHSPRLSLGVREKQCLLAPEIVHEDYKCEGEETHRGSAFIQIRSETFFRSKRETVSSCSWNCSCRLQMCRWRISQGKCIHSDQILQPPPAHTGHPLFPETFHCL